LAFTDFEWPLDFEWLRDFWWLRVLSGYGFGDYGFGGYGFGGEPVKASR
jgi:hypothetical protein